MSEPSWPEWGASPDRYYPWHVWTSPEGGHHAGHLLDTVIGPSVEALGAQQVYEILRCEPCLTIHAVPLPSHAALKRYYEAAFVEQDKPGYIENCLRDKPWWDCCMHGPLLKQAKGYLRGIDSPDLLEIGAGPGLALDLAAQWGWATTAIEPGEAFCEYLMRKNHTVYAGTLEDYTRPSGCYHIVYLHEVLEHQPCGEDFLLRCWDVLRPGGVLVCVVPNDCNPLQYAACRHLGVQPYWWAVPQHLAYYTPKMLQLLVRRCGYRIQSMRGTFPLDENLLKGYNYLGNDRIGRMVHGWRMQDELWAVKAGLWDARVQQYRRQLAERRVGREIILIACKA